MVATVIMIIMVGLVIRITSQVLNVWNKSAGRLAANAEARIAMDFLTSDLEAAVFRNNGQQWMRVEGGAGGNLVSSGSPPYTSQTIALKFFSPVSDSDPDIAGDICGVSYRLAFQGAYIGSGAPEVYALYRMIAEPDETFNALLDTGSMVTSRQKELRGVKTGTDNSGEEVSSDVWEGIAVAAPENFLAANVVDFKVLLYATDDLGDELELNPAQHVGNYLYDYVYGGSDKGLQSAPDVGTLTAPSYADIILRVISNEAAELLSNGESWRQSGFDTADAYVTANSQVFTRRVYLATSPF